MSLATSWRALPADARDDLTRLSAFSGPFDLDDAAAVLPLVGSPLERLERLEDLDDVQEVYSNADISEDVLAEL